MSKTDPTPTPAMTEAYKLGREWHGMDLSELIWSLSYEQSEALTGDSVLSAFFDAGYYGTECPSWVVGERFGDIPTDGKSWNYRDDRWEAGVSLVRLSDGSRTTQEIESMILVAAGRDLVKVAGWLVTHTTGADGEPLVVGAVRI